MRAYRVAYIGLTDPYMETWRDSEQPEVHT